LWGASYETDSGTLRPQTDAEIQCNYMHHSVLLTISKEDGDCT
jgi:hypothetical protein